MTATATKRKKTKSTLKERATELHSEMLDLWHFVAGLDEQTAADRLAARDAEAREHFARANWGSFCANFEDESEAKRVLRQLVEGAEKARARLRATNGKRSEAAAEYEATLAERGRVFVELASASTGREFLTGWKDRLKRTPADRNLKRDIDSALAEGYRIIRKRNAKAEQARRDEETREVHRRSVAARELLEGRSKSSALVRTAQGFLRALRKVDAGDVALHPVRNLAKVEQCRQAEKVLVDFLREWGPAAPNGNGSV